VSRPRLASPPARSRGRGTRQQEGTLRIHISCTTQGGKLCGPEMTSGAPGEMRFDYSQPFSIDIGRAAVIAEELRRRGYSCCFADEVTAELRRPEPERGTIGHLAAELLESAGWP
jgi:hypothetical protein